MLENLRLFLLIVEKGGMAAAGREMGLAPATVSGRLAALEEHFGTQLLHRTTRSLSPTGEGIVLLEGARRLLDEMQELDAQVRLGTEQLAGDIRISAPLDLGRNWLVPLLDAFALEHPELHVDLHLSDGYVDLARGGFDLALRYGALYDSTLRVRKLADVRRIVCAAPRYLNNKGTPQTPTDLSAHNCLLIRFGDGRDRHWPFRVENKEVRVTVRGNRTSNDGELVRRWCVSGYGIARKSESDVMDDLKENRLVRLLSEFEIAPIALQLVYPGGRPPVRRVRMLIDRIVEMRSSLSP